MAKGEPSLGADGLVSCVRGGAAGASGLDVAEARKEKSDDEPDKP
jgi:hypothetical protein